MKQRESFKVLMPKLQEERINRDECPSCGLPKKDWKRRKDWRCCSTKCTDTFFHKYQILGWPGLRRIALDRDNNKCVMCGSKGQKKIVKWESLILQTEDSWKNWMENSYTIIEYFYEKGILCAWVEDNYALIGDHIIPIALGGEQWDIDNIQTLCHKCNQIKTAQDMKKIAKERRIEKIVTGGQLQLNSKHNGRWREKHGKI